jgi:hypothetical protein
MDIHRSTYARTRPAYVHTYACGSHVRAVYPSSDGRPCGAGPPPPGTCPSMKVRTCEVRECTPAARLGELAYRGRGRGRGRGARTKTAGRWQDRPRRVRASRHTCKAYDLGQASRRRGPRPPRARVSRRGVGCVIAARSSLAVDRAGRLSCCYINYIYRWYIRSIGLLITKKSLDQTVQSGRDGPGSDVYKRKSVMLEISFSRPISIH